MPILLSTGFGTLSEIDTAVRIIEEAGNRQIVLLHCVSMYPPEDRQINLNNIDTLRMAYSYPIGFSDHTIGFSIAIAAAAKGAWVIEKHFTLDKAMFGWDHGISADLMEMKTIVKESKRVHEALGTNKIVANEDKEKREAFRRSIVTSREIKKGEIFKEDMIDYKRPGDGIEPGYIKLLIGRAAKRDIGCDEVIKMDDF